jgi:hypothetical protein
VEHTTGSLPCYLCTRFARRNAPICAGPKPTPDGEGRSVSPFAKATEDTVVISETEALSSRCPSPPSRARLDLIAIHALLSLRAQRRIHGIPIHHCLFPSSDFRRCARFATLRGSWQHLNARLGGFSLDPTLISEALCKPRTTDLRLWL